MKKYIISEKSVKTKQNKTKQNKNSKLIYIQFHISQLKSRYANLFFYFLQNLFV